MCIAIDLFLKPPLAFSERAILHHSSSRITLRYGESNTDRPRTLRLASHEFIRRFLQHVLPSGFRKVRYVGLHHSSKRPVLRLLQAAMSLRAGLPLPTPMPAPEPIVPACPNCQSPMRLKGRRHANERAADFLPATPTRGPP